MLKHLDLFSGIGGFALGLESTGQYETLAFCEIEKYPQRVLKKHWPEVPCYDDIQELGAERLAADGIGRVDIVTGGVPCQPVSLAGQRKGDADDRWLWPEFFRVVTEIRPTWIILENVVGLRTLGADRMLADLAGADYAAWPLVVGARYDGSPQNRKRVWIVAHAQVDGLEGWNNRSERIDAARKRLLSAGPMQHAWPAGPKCESKIPRATNGLPCGLHRCERLKALGNAVVPQIVAAIGRAICRL